LSARGRSNALRGPTKQAERGAEERAEGAEFASAQDEKQQWEMGLAGCMPLAHTREVLSQSSPDGRAILLRHHHLLKVREGILHVVQRQYNRQITAAVHSLCHL
jgi:hypothetical protein